MTAVGLDLGDRWSRYCVRDRSGEIFAEARVRTTATESEARFGPMAATRAVMEWADSLRAPGKEMADSSADGSRAQGGSSERTEPESESVVAAQI